MLKSMIATVLLTTFSVSSFAIELKGHLTQGGLVTGKLEHAKSVSLDGANLKLSSEGDFVFGFGRDAKANHTLEWVDSNGKKHSQPFIITKRDYKIDKITGVAKKYVSPPKSVSERISKEAVAVRKARNVESDLTYFLDPVLKPAQGRISGVYGSQRYFNGEPRRPHFGLDIANKTGSPVYAPIGRRQEIHSRSSGKGPSPGRCRLQLSSGSTSCHCLPTRGSRSFPNRSTKAVR